MHFKIITTVSLVTTCHHTKILHHIDYILHTAHFMSITHLFSNCMFLSLNLLYLFLSSLQPPPLWKSPVWFFICDCFCFAMSFHWSCFSDFTVLVKWYGISFSVWLISFSIIPSSSTYCCQWQNNIVFDGGVVFRGMHTPYLSDMWSWSQGDPKLASSCWDRANLLVGGS